MFVVLVSDQLRDSWLLLICSNWENIFDVPGKGWVFDQTDIIESFTLSFINGFTGAGLIVFQSSSLKKSPKFPRFETWSEILTWVKNNFIGLNITGLSHQFCFVFSRSWHQGCSPNLDSFRQNMPENRSFYHNTAHKTKKYPHTVFCNQTSIFLPIWTSHRVEYKVDFFTL